MTSESISIPRSVSGSEENRPRFAVHPTTGTLQIRPEYRDKAAKALMREVRRMKFRLKLRLLSLYFRQFALNLRSVALAGEGYLVRNLNKLTSKGCHGSTLSIEPYSHKPGLLSSPGYSPL